MDRDRNLLFGVFAVQLRKVTPSQIMAAAGAWASDPSKDLVERLIEDGAVSETDREFLDRLVAEAIEAHDGDAAATLVTLGGPTQVERSFYGSVMISPTGDVETVLAGESASDTQSLGVEESPGRYSQVGETARGGMGRILLVHDEFLGRDVALKELLPGLTPSGGDQAAQLSPAREGMSLLTRFLQEARITGQLEHPSIVPVYELGHRSDGTIYYTMKLVRGQTLEEAIESARGLQARLGLLSHFIDLCQGIAYSHSLNVIHRDIKPSNVMVGKFGETVVLDWGLAKVKGKEDVHSEEIKETLRLMNLGEDEAVGRTAYGEIMGTPLYMPPEQAKGQLDEVDERSDVYSLGAVLYELLTGRPPFEPAPAKLVLEKVIGEPPRHVRELSPDVPAELAAICEKALAKDPKKRYKSVKALADEVQRFQSGALVEAYDYRFIQHAGRFARRHKAVLGTALAFILLFLAVGALYYGRLVQTNQELIRITESERQQSARLEKESYVRSIRHAQSLVDQQQYSQARDILESTNETERHWEWDFLMSKSNPRVGVLKGLHAVDGPNGEWIATLDAKSPEVSIWSGDDFSLQSTLRGHNALVLCQAISPASGLLATGDEDGVIRLWNVREDRELNTWPDHDQPVRDLVFSENGNLLVALVGVHAVAYDVRNDALLSRFTDIALSENSIRADSRAVYSIASNLPTVVEWDVRTGREIRRFEGHGGPVTSLSVIRDGKTILTTSLDRSARVWDAGSGQTRHVLTGHLSGVWHACINASGERALTVSDDGSAKWWDVETGSLIKSTPSTGRKLRAATLFADDRSLVLMSDQGNATQWNADELRPLSELHQGSIDLPVVDVRSGHGADRVYMALGNGETHVLQTTTSFARSTLERTGQGRLNSASLSRDGRAALLISQSGHSEVLDTLSGNRLLSLDAPVAAMDALSTLVASASLAGVIEIRRSQDGEVQRSFEVPSGVQVIKLLFAMQGQVLVSHASDNRARVWDVSSGNSILETDASNVFVSGSNEEFVISINQSSASPFDLSSKQSIEPFTLSRSALPPSAVFFNAEDLESIVIYGGESQGAWRVRRERGSDFLASGSARRSPTIAIYPSPNGERFVRMAEDFTAEAFVAPDSPTELTGYPGQITSVAFSEDAQRVVTGLVSGTFVVWDVETGAELLKIPAHQAPVTRLVSSTDGTTLLSSADTGPVKIWRMNA